MKVLKFGGSSVGSAESLLQVKQIVASQRQAVVVVVSAFKGVTDQLLQLATHSVEGNKELCAVLFAQLVEQHKNIVEQLFGEAQKVQLQEQLQALFDELCSILEGVSLVGELSERTADAIVAYGERLSSLIVAQLIAGAQHIDARSLIRTQDVEGKQVVDFEQTNAAIKTAFSAFAPQITLMGGFIASDSQSGRTTTLGRGGSDYTAAILAAALEAEALEIWTDVDGFMTADPRLVRHAYTIDQLSYKEATELCNFGAKVIYPPTIYPVFAKKIPIYVRNTFRPNAAYTCICEHPKATERLIRGISSIVDTSLITVSGLSMVGVIGINRRIFAALAAHGVSVFMVAQLASETSTSLCVAPSEVQRACEILDKEFAHEIEVGAMSPTSYKNDLSTIAVVGENMQQQTGVVGNIFSVLGRNGINVCAAAVGSLETSISFVIDRTQLHKTLSVLHDSFFLSDNEVVNIFLCGTGTVGGMLLEQIAAQHDTLMTERGINFKVVGISGRSKAIFNAQGLELNDYEQQLEESTSAGGIKALVEKILEMNLSNPVFVDCTAAEEVAAEYEGLLQHNVHVVTANKIAASGNYEHYQRLKQVARQRGVKFLFETNVGAGLPIINTIKDLTASGDKIVGIEAVLSGTLNYVFNTLCASTSFSQAVRMAQENGYSEPDPRLDLSGMDVVRKITILARESGYRVETSEIENRSFLPKSLFDVSLEEFWEQLPSLDEEFQNSRKSLAEQNKCWRFVAEWKNGKGSVGLKEIPQGHPLYDLEGSNNIVCLTTERYDAPMLIQGYGAGAAVTAAGVFSDIMRVANL